MTPQPATRWIEVNRDEYRLTLFARPPDSWKFKPVRRYRIGVGQQGLETNPGHYLISDKQRHPIWIPPNSEWVDESIRGRRFEAKDPDNPIKARWLGIADAEGIHGIAKEHYGSLGRAESHGCIRMRQEDVIELYDKVPLYTPIRIW